MKSDPFKNLVLDSEEQELEDAIDLRKIKSVLNPQMRTDLVKASHQHIEKLHTRPITLRVREKDLEKIKQKALEQAMPYQTLLSSLFHQFAEDKITLKWTD